MAAIPLPLTPLYGKFPEMALMIANILSCVLGIETVIHNPHYRNDNEIDKFDCIKYQHLIASSHSLMDNSKLLHSIVKILQNNKDIMIEEKYDSAKKILIELTIEQHFCHYFYFLTCAVIVLFLPQAFLYLLNYVVLILIEIHNKDTIVHPI
jgi:hypothetical protein